MRYVAAGAFFFSLMMLLVKVAGERLPSQEIVLVRGLLTLAFTWAMLRRAGVRGHGTRRWTLLLRGLLGFGALSCQYYAVVRLPLADATVLQYTNPIWTAVLAVWLLDEQMRRIEVGLVLASLVGVVLIVRPGFLFGQTAAMDVGTVGVALLGALFSAGSYVTVRRLSRTEHPLIIIYYFTLVTVPASLPAALTNLVWPTPREWLLLLAIGLTAQGGQVYLTRGLQLEPAGRATAVGYLQIVFATAWGALLFRDFPDVWMICGTCIIVGCTLLLGRLHTGAVPPAPVADEAANIEGVEIPRSA